MPVEIKDLVIQAKMQGDDKTQAKNEEQAKKKEDNDNASMSEIQLEIERALEEHEYNKYIR